MAHAGMEPLYDINASWADNLERGPRFDGPWPERRQPPAEEWVDFLGFKVASRIGVPAGPLLDSRWTTAAGRLGFDIVTYKTIRTGASEGHAAPNVLFLQPPGQLDTWAAGPGDAPPPPLRSAGQERPPGCRGADVAITNSFGMPSVGRDALLRDIPAALAGLGPGQLLVVSVTGTPGRADGVGFMEDFVEAALLAKQAGAPVVEANLSCPNVGSGQGALYADAEQVGRLTRALAAALGPEVPLLLKVGAFESERRLEEVLVAAAAAGARGVCGINGLSRAILAPDGRPALGPARPTSGVCGAPIRTAALEFVAAARRVIVRRALPLALVGVGGVTEPEHARALLAAGADVAQSATGAIFDPLLAAKFHRPALEGREREAAAAAAVAAQCRGAACGCGGAAEGGPVGGEAAGGA